jgi:hypothetical protein
MTRGLSSLRAPAPQDGIDEGEHEVRGNGADLGTKRAMEVHEDASENGPPDRKHPGAEAFGWRSAERTRERRGRPHRSSASDTSRSEKCLGRSVARSPWWCRCPGRSAKPIVRRCLVANVVGDMMRGRAVNRASFLGLAGFAARTSCTPSRRLLRDRPRAANPSDRVDRPAVDGLSHGGGRFERRADPVPASRRNQIHAGGAKRDGAAKWIRVHACS